MAKAPDSLRVRRAIEAGDLPPVWLWTGPEEFLKDELFRKLVESVLEGDPAGLNHDRFRAGQSEAENIVPRLQTLPMMAGKRVVLWADIEALKKGERDRLIDYVKNPSPDTVLVLTSNRGPRDSLNRRLENSGARSAVFWVPFANQTQRWIQLQFKERGLDCPAPVAAQLLAACTGSPGEQTPLKYIAPEIEKVALTAGSRGAVTPDDLGVIAKKPGQDSLRALTQAVGERSLPKALRALDQALLFKENAPVRIVATVALFLKSVAQAQDLLAGGMNPTQVPKAAGIWPREWDRIHGAAQGFSPGEPRRLLSALARADRTLKSTAVDPRLLLEDVLRRLCAPETAAL